MELLKKIAKRIVIIVIVVVFLSFIAYVGFWSLFFFDSHREKLIFKENSDDKRYELIVYEIGSAFPYFPSDIKLELKHNNKLVDTKEFTISNDGKRITEEGNFKIEWKDEKVIITTMGEEQEDEIIEIDLKE